MIDHHPKKLFSKIKNSENIQDLMEKLILGSQIKIRGKLVNTPDGSRVYKGCWVRDFTMMCEIGAPLIDSEYIKRGLDLFFEHQGPNGEIPDWVPYEQSKNVVYSLFDKHHFLDNPLWLTRLMFLYLKQSGDFEYFKSHENKLISGLNSESLFDDENPVLCIQKSKIKDEWGFCDCIKKTGVVLFANLIKIDALRSLSMIYRELGNESLYMKYNNQISKILEGIEVLFDKEKNLYYSATGIGHKIDVWGNAFAVYLKILPESRANDISKALHQNRNKFVWKGQIRHLFKGKFWDGFHEGAESLKYKKNQYQNGAYWGTPTGWVAYSFEKAVVGSGQKLINDLLSFYLKKGIYECVYPRIFGVYKKCNHYVASLALPFRLIKF